MAVSGQFVLGHEKVGGRKAGTPNKATAEVKLLAREYGPEAIKKLAKLMRGKDRHTDQLIKKLLEEPLESASGRVLATKLLNALEQRKPENELGAAKELLDRGYGKASIPLTDETGEGPARIVIERRIVDPRVVEGEVIEPGGSVEQNGAKSLEKRADTEGGTP